MAKIEERIRIDNRKVSVLFSTAAPNPKGRAHDQAARLCAESFRPDRIGSEFEPAFPDTRCRRPEIRTAIAETCPLCPAPRLPICRYPVCLALIVAELRSRFRLSPSLEAGLFSR